MKYRIKNIVVQMWWSTELENWTRDKSKATVFDESEKETFPIHGQGKWTIVKKDVRS